MPVETYIATGERTFVEYLVRPLLDSFGRAFREARLTGNRPRSWRLPIHAFSCQI